MFSIPIHSALLLAYPFVQLVHGVSVVNESSQVTQLPSSHALSSPVWSSISAASTNTTSGNTTTYYGSDDLGELVPCAGPTPPPGLSFPIETVVEKLSAIDGPTTKAVLNTDIPNSWFWTTSTYTAATTVYTTWTRQQVPQLNPYAGDSRPCCGMCTVYFSLVDLWYWPVPGANTACLDNAITSDSGTVTSPAVVYHNNTVSTAVGPDGFTYTSPSIYVAYHDISASNRCGQIGPKHTSVTLSFAPGSLSTLDYAPGIFAGPYGGQPKPFDLSNLPCPPQSVLDAQESANQVGFSLPARPRYAPIIAPPPEIQKMEPAWEACKSQFAFDPPRSLVPASALVPLPTPANQAGPQLAPPMPSPSIEDPPAQTESGKGPAAVGSSSSGDPSPNLPDTMDPPNTKGPNTEGKQGNAAEPNSPNNKTPATDGKHGNAADSDSPNNKAPTKDGKHGNAADSDSPNNKAPTKDGKQGNAPEPGSLNVDPLSQPEAAQNDPEKPNAPELPDLGSDGIIRPVPNPSVLEIGRQTFTALSSGDFAIADTTLQANGPAVTIQGVSISLDKSTIVVGSSTLALPTGSGNGVLTAAGQTFTPLGGGSILVNGNTLSVNGPPTTASGTVLSLASSGLVVDSQIFALPTPAPEYMPNTKNTITFAGQAFTQLGSDVIAFHGMTLVANGPAATISGTVISLASSNLVVGSQTFALPTPAPELMSNANNIITFAGQTFTRFGSDAVAFHGTTLVANGPGATISGTVISLASSDLVVGSQTFALPTPAPNAFPSAVVIDGITLTAGASAMTISGNTLSLAFGSSGLYVAGHGSGSSTFSVPMTAGESASMDAEGHLVVEGSGDVGDLGSAIMLGFGPPNGAATASATGKRIGTTPENSSNATTGVLGFTGKGSRCSNLHVMAVFGLALCISLAILQ